MKRLLITLCLALLVNPWLKAEALTAGSLKHFKESRAKTLAFLKATEDLREHAVDSPVGKKLDASQWVLFVSAHCERHTKQINEVKADPNFPKE